MEDLKKDYQRFDEPPFSTGRVACGINALIEVFDLSVEKLPKNNISMSQVALKLYELSIEDRRQVMGVGAQSLQLQEIIDKKCNDVYTIEDILKLTEQKYQHLMNTRTLI